MSKELTNLEKLYEGIRLLRCYNPTSIGIENNYLFIYLTDESESMARFDSDQLVKLGWSYSNNVLKSWSFGTKIYE